MAIPWYTSELPLRSSPEPRRNLFSTHNNVVHHHHNISIDSNSSANNKKFLSMNSVRNLIMKSSTLIKLPERDIDKICSISGEDGSSHHSDISDDYSGHNYYHTGLIHRAFLPMRLGLMITGRWPFRMGMMAVTSRAKRRIQLTYSSDDYYNNGFNSQGHPVATRVRNYDDSLKSPLWIYFGLTTMFLGFVLTMSTVGFFDFFLEWSILPGDNWKSLGKNSFHDNLVVFLVVWGCLVHSTLSSISMFIHRKKMAKIFNFWNVAADELIIDEVRSHRRFLIAANAGYIIFLVLLYFAYSTWNVRLIRDGATLFGRLAIRPLFTEEQLSDCDEGTFRLFGIITMIYAIYASRAFLFIFSFKCRLLRSLFRVWNARLVHFLRKPDNYNNEKQEATELMEKVECYRLLSDMSILLKMVKQMDKMFATVLQAYYCVQLLNMCFELYMLAKSGSQEFTRNASNRSLDIITAVLTLCQNVYFFFTVSLDGAYVGEEAEKGHEALRRHPITPQSSTQKKYLVYNLSGIYNKRIVLTGGKFFTIDRPFIITVLGAVLTYFVIIMQIQPSLQKDTT